MTTERTYFDYNASAPLRPEARAAMLAALDVSANASSVHEEGRRARGVIEAAREEVAALAGARPSEIVFTSGATEANNWALRGGWQAILMAGIEHDSIRAPAERSGADHVAIATGADGVASIENFEAAANAVSAPGRALVVLQLANNETGVIQPVAEAASVARANKLAVHCDAVQAAGRITLDFKALGVDTMSLSAHKIGGPQGVGALVIRDGASLAPFIVGGGQERRRRAGTENVAAIAGFGAAARLAKLDLARMGRVRALRDRLEAGIVASTPDAIIIGRDAPRLANTSCFARPGQLAETLVIRLDLAGFAVSSGAACSSGKVGRSHVLDAMGLAPSIVAGAIRVSIGVETTENEISAFLAAWDAIRDGARIAA